MNRFKELRTEKGLSQKKLAELLGISQSVICDYEKEKVVPTATVTCMYADFFNVSTDFLLGREDELGQVQIVASTSLLSKDEKTLLECFRKLGPFERESILVQIDALSSEEYNARVYGDKHKTKK